MGDRANIQVKSGNSDVFLYTHWSGSDLPSILQAALIRGRSRWDDGQYLARIIFDQMTDGDTGLTGFGISSTVGDGDNRILLVDVDKQTVSNKQGSKTFEDYVGVPLNW